MKACVVCNNVTFGELFAFRVNVLDLENVFEQDRHPCAYRSKSLTNPGKPRCLKQEEKNQKSRETVLCAFLALFSQHLNSRVWDKRAFLILSWQLPNFILSCDYVIFIVDWLLNLLDGMEEGATENAEPQRIWPISGVAQLCFYFGGGEQDTHFQGHLIQPFPRRCFGVMANGTSYSLLQDILTLSLFCRDWTSQSCRGTMLLLCRWWQTCLV